MLQTEFMQLLLATLATHGWIVYRVDGFDEPMPYTCEQILEYCAEVDEALVRVRHPEHGTARLLFIWQGPIDSYDYGEEVLSDYSTKLERVIEEVYAACS